MTTWFEQNAVALIGHALTVIGIVGAAATVVWQLGRQHRSSLLLQRDNVRAELKLRLHEQLVQKVRRLSDANMEAAMYAYMIPFNVENFQRQLEQGFNPSPIKERAPEFSRLHAEAGYAIGELIEEFEAWSIAFPGLKVFQIALNVAAYDTREAFPSLFTALIRVLPIDPPENAPPNMPRPRIPNPISSDEHAQLKKLVEHYKQAIDEIGCYIHDLTIESQNNLLSDLFERRVPPRQPLDPRHKVITADPEKAGHLLHYFENETPWGKAKKATEADVRAMLEKS
jgi:hypothetical protein